MVLIQYHLSYVRIEDILDYPNWFTRPRIPNLDASLTGHKNFQTFLTEPSAADCFIVCVVGDKRPSVLKHGKVSGTADQTPVLWHCPDTLYFISICYVERLNAAVI